MAPDPRPDDKARVQSVERATALLRAVAHATGPDARVRELAAVAGLNRVTAWRILRTLEGQGMVHLDPHTRQYAIGTTVVELARAAPAQTWTSRAHDVLQTLSLQTRETTALALCEARDLRYVDQVDSPGSHEESWLGTSAEPLHATSTGKVFLAYAGRPAGGLLAEPLERFTDTTITTLTALEEELAVVRRQGYALCRGEYSDATWGVAAPLLGEDQRLLGVLSCWGPVTRGEPERFAALGSLVRDTARRLVTA